MNEIVKYLRFCCEIVLELQDCVLLNTHFSRTSSLFKNCYLHTPNSKHRQRVYICLVILSGTNAQMARKWQTQ